ncbi:hypothetical protein ILUMI_27353 [Ignelater luminosus]|uniref:Mutator-like transposase domain-containing protein n=1 Tax=Ignelater luminosus TaxID=2038154 RepID=A0A8K0FY20_IGNLU|nr:hypothetical protein ILUMI_27353 [Ignelater luminosus]
MVGSRQTLAERLRKTIAEEEQQQETQKKLVPNPCYETADQHPGILGSSWTVNQSYVDQYQPVGSLSSALEVESSTLKEPNTTHLPNNRPIIAGWRYERNNVSESTEVMQDALHMLDTPDSNVGFETSSANSTFTTENANTFTAENADAENGSRELPEEATESSIGSACSSKINNTNDSEGLVGNRIVDILYVLECLKRINLHGERFGCSINNLVFTLERRYGLRSELFFKCNMCNETFKLSTVDPNGTSINLNTAAVAGCMNTGNGYSNMEELLSVMNIPPIDSKAISVEAEMYIISHLSGENSCEMIHYTTKMRK